jgi:acyl-CoA synthetase (AMP-forming)/AMP-acid ligase II
VPAMLAGLFNDPGFARADVSSFRLVIFGASPMPVDWIGRTARAFPSAQLANCYGLTETAPDLTISDPVEYGAAIRSGATDGPIRAVGKPALGVELRIVGLDGNDVPPGEPGEIWARGPNIMKGYLNLPEETEKALAGGWLHTGDIGRIDADGFVYILDRLKDVVVTGGENVYATEVESALCTHSAVREAAVIGVPDDRLVEAVFAVVVAAPGAQPTADELIGHCRGRIGGYKIPRRVAFVDALPKSAMGKVLKDELRRRFAKSPAGVA